MSANVPTMSDFNALVARVTTAEGNISVLQTATSQNTASINTINQKLGTIGQTLTTLESEISTGSSMTIVSVTSQPSTTGTTPFSAFYVSPTGSDSNPGTNAAPFLTLERAQTAMRGSTVKTTVLMAGQFNRNGSSFVLSAQDAGTTWQFDPGPNLYCTAIIDGGGTGNIFDVQASNITINGLQFQNSTNAGIQLTGAPHNGGTAVSGCFIKNNYVHNISNVDGAAIGIWASPNNKVYNNIIMNTNSKGMSCESTQNGDLHSGSDFQNNVLINTNTGNPDNGAFYSQDRNSGGGQSTNITVKNNFIRDYGSVANFNKGLYFDDGASNITATDNIICGLGQFAIQYHGGDNNTVSNNIVDLGKNGNQFIMFYQSSPSQTVNNMAGNSFTGNIVISGGTAAPQSFDTNISGQALPTVSGNDYFAYGSGGINDSGSGITDASPSNVDPKLSGHDYVQGGGGFGGFPALPRGWGPPGLVINSSTGVVTLNGTQIAGAGTVPAYD